jgi:membrane protein YdbS with pleckstrin-like domain
VLFFIVIPAIPGALLWWFLKPVMFWEKFACVVTTMIFYVIILLFIISFILDRIYKEEGEEETMDENEE